MAEQSSQSRCSIAAIKRSASSPLGSSENQHLNFKLERERERQRASEVVNQRYRTSTFSKTKSMMDRFAFLTIAALLTACLLASPCAAEPDTDDEPLETFTLDEPSARTFITVNGSNIITTPNFVVGVTLIGIALALLAGSAASAASVAAASSLAGGNINGPGKYKRSLPDDAIFSNLAGASSVLKAVTSLEQQFRNFDITDVECRKRIICEIHQENIGAVKSLGQISDIVLNVLNNVNSDSSGKTSNMKQYLEAADHGKAQRECSQLYNTCEYSIKKVLRNIGF